jgi:hypothetical protein
MTPEQEDKEAFALIATTKAEPHGWVTWWPRPGGGSSTVYSHGAERPNYGPELNALLRTYPVFTAD